MVWIIDGYSRYGLTDATDEVLEHIDMDEYEEYLNQTADPIVIDGVKLLAGTTLRRAGEATFQESAWQWVSSLRDSICYLLDSMCMGDTEDVHGVQVEFVDEYPCSDDDDYEDEDEFEEAV